MLTCRRKQIALYLSPCTKLKSKRIKDLNKNPATLNVIEYKMQSTLECVGTEDYRLLPKYNTSSTDTESNN